MRAALRSLAVMRDAGKAVAVVGEMRELGADSEGEHRAIGELAAGLGIDTLVAVGDGAAPVAEAFQAAGGQHTHQCPDTDAARELLEQILAPGDVALLKSSRDSGLRFLGDALVEEGAG